MDYLISIVLPIYNAENYLDKSINALLNQTYKNLQIILINDGSTDKSKKICETYAKKDSRIKLINIKNAGVSNARNVGKNSSDGNYIIFVDSDDYIDSDLVEKLVNNIEENILIGTFHKIVKKGKIVNAFYNKNCYQRRKFVEEILKNNIHGSVWGYLFDSEIAKKIDFDTNTSYMEDTIFLLEYITNVKDIKFIKDESYYYYFKNEQGISNGIDIKKYINNIIYSLGKIRNLIEKEQYDLFYLKQTFIIENIITRSTNYSQMRGILLVFREIKLQYETNSIRYAVFVNLFKSNKVWTLNIYRILIKVLRKFN